MMHILIGFTLLFFIAGCGSGDNDITLSPSVSYDDVRIGSQQDIKLEKLLNTPVRFIKSEEELNAFYDELNVTRDSAVSPDFSTDTVLYIQRTFNMSYLEDHNLTIKAETEGVRLISRVYQEVNDPKYSIFFHRYLGSIIVLYNGKDIPIRLTKEALVRGASDGGKSGPGEILSSDPSIMDTARLVLTHTSLKDYDLVSHNFWNEQRFELLMQKHFEEEEIFEVDWEDYNEQVLFSGALYSDKNVSYTSPQLKSVNQQNMGSYGVGGSAGGLFWEFAVSGYRSDCEEYNPIVPELTFYIISKYISNNTAAQDISVKSCTPFTQTPSKGQMDWFDDEFIPMVSDAD